MSTEQERRLILGMVQEGKITAGEGLHLIKALDDSESHASDEVIELPASSDQAEADVDSVITPLELASVELEGVAGEIDGTPPLASEWHNWWQYPLWTGVIITVVGALLMYWAQQSYGIGFLFLCAWIPLLLGIFLMALAWQTRSQRWLHLRVEQPPGDWPRRISISFPVAPVSWFLRTFKGRIVALQDPAVEELLRALEENTSPDNPLFVEVQEGEHGERVQIFIG